MLRCQREGRGCLGAPRELGAEGQLILLPGLEPLLSCSALVDTARGFLSAAQATPTALGMPITPLPARPLLPLVAAAGGGVGGQGEGKAPSRQREAVSLPS